MNKSILPLLMLPIMMGSEISEIKDEFDDIDIEKEYKLIKNKKSKLGYQDRQEIIYRYKSTKGANNE